MSTTCTQQCTSSSDVCYKVTPDPVPVGPFTAEEIVAKFANAVVEVHSEFILTAGLTGVNGSTPLGVTGTPGDAGAFGSTGRADIFLEGNGFFIKDYYIVTPASLVLMPPSWSSVCNRYPFLDPTNLDLGQMKNQMVRASRILVSVFDVNGDGHSFAYEADLVGVDGAGDVAILKINPKRQWNICNPCISDKHPYFQFGSSRCATKGEDVFLLGDYLGTTTNLPFNAVGALTTGVLSDNRYVDYDGQMLPESVLVSANVYTPSTGLPILNNKGEVLGMQTTSISGTLLGVSFDGRVCGPSEFFMRRIIKALIKAHKNQNCRKKCDERTVFVNDPAGSYFKYVKGYLGIAYEVFTSHFYDVTKDYTNAPVENDSKNGDRVRLDLNGNFLNSPSCKELIGIIVRGLAGANPGDNSDGTVLPGGVTGSSSIYVPGGNSVAPLVSSLQPSPFLNKLQSGDVITHMQGVGLGDLYGQAAPSLVTWRLLPGDQVELFYRRGGNYPNDGPNNSTAGNYDNLLTISGVVIDFPELMDYPWYRYPIPGFQISLVEFNFGTQSSSGGPYLEDGAQFSPAL